MAYDVTLSTKITGPVGFRLRTFAALENRPLTHLVDELLSRGLPSTDELASRVRDSDFGTVTDFPAPPETEETIAAPTEAAA